MAVPFGEYPAGLDKFWRHDVVKAVIRSIVVRLAMVLAVSLALASGANAQRYLGSIQGEVTDPSGAVVSGATVSVTEASTQFKADTKTNDAGVYNFPALNPGTYVVATDAKGFRLETVTGVVLTAGQMQKIDFKLSVGTSAETVEVVADNPLIDTGSANIATTLSTQEVTDLPNIGRNPFVLATLAAGVINSGSGGYFQGKSSQFTNPFSGAAVQITSNGSGGHNRITLNGIPDDPAERFSGASYTGFVPSPEAVQEVKVQSSIFDAQVGHGNGTVTNTVVRNGTNNLHGALYYAFQNTYLNANTSEKAHIAAPRNNDQLSQTGFVVDGPVVLPKIYDGRNKTFFMVAFERYASHTAINYSSRVPTAAELTGDFSALCNTFNGSGFCTSGIQLYMPNSPVDGSGNRTQYFANNNIASAIAPAGANLASFYPGPNVPGASVAGTNYISTHTSYPSKYPSFIVRIDHSINKNDTFNAIYFQAGLTQNFPLQGFPKGIGPGGYGYNVYRNTRGGSLDEVHTFSSSMVLDSRFGLTYHPFGLVYPGSQGYDLSSLGISGAGLPYASFPGVSNGDGYASLASGAGGQISEDTTGSLEEILTKTIKTHTIRFGFEGNLIRYNVQNPQSGFGNFNFDRRFTQQNMTTGDVNSGDSLADLLLGTFSSTSYNITPAYALQQIYAAPFVQDDWRVTSKLTVNLGLRWDYESPFTERYNKQASNFCTTCVNPLQSSVPGLPLYGGLQYTNSSNRYAYPREFGEFQPRLGFAYQVQPKTVLRAGFGLIYFNTLENPPLPNQGATGFSSSTSYNNVSGSTPINPLSNPFPAGVALPTGSSLGLSTALGQNVAFIDPAHVQPRSTEFSVSVQHQLPGSWALQVAYVGTRPTHLEVSHNINILPASAYNQGTSYAQLLAYQKAEDTMVANPMAGKIPLSTTLNAPTIKQSLLQLPFPEFGGVTENYSPIGRAPYNALQIQISKPMKHHYSLQGNMTWDKLMLHNGYLDNYAAALGRLDSVQDSAPTLFGNVFGTYELPKFEGRPYLERLILGGWQLNSVARFSNGSLISAPGNVNIIGNYKQPNWTLTRQFNTCFNDVTGTPVPTGPPTGLIKVTGCDATSPTPAFQQRLGYTSQNNSPVLNIRQQLHPLLDASMFKKFILREGVSFEIRGEFYNILNTPEWGGPSTSLGAQNAGSSASGYTTANPMGIFNQANDPRIGELTARINF
jgi:hypothetical protein